MDETQQIVNSIVKPEHRLLRCEEIIGNQGKGIVGIFPQSRSKFDKKVKSGDYPPPVYPAGSRVPYWRLKDIIDLINGDYQSEGVA